MLIPKYLENWTRIKRNTKDSIVVEAVCECDHAEFQVFKNIVIRSDEHIEKEKKIEVFGKRYGWRSVEVGALEDGKVYMYKKNIFGKIVDKVELPSELSGHTNIIKIKCAKCGKEYIAFDNRIHGYNAFIDERESSIDTETEFEQKTFKRSKDNVFEIEIHVINQLSFEEFCENNDGCNAEDYSNAFGDITIYARIKDVRDKKVMIFSEETQ